MANPQIEEGFTRIANTILDALIMADLSGQDYKISMLIIRKTYGFGKKEDAVSLSQMMTATGMGKIRCSQVVTRLQLMKILTVTENINGICKKYRFNKDFEKWGTVKKNINRYQKMKSTVKVFANPPLMKTLTTKETITKETITKEKKSDFVLPDFIPKETWQTYMTVRLKKKAAQTPYALRLIIKELTRLRDTFGNDPVEVLN